MFMLFLLHRDVSYVQEDILDYYNSVIDFFIKQNNGNLFTYFTITLTVVLFAFLAHLKNLSIFLLCGL